MFKVAPSPARTYPNTEYVIFRHISLWLSGITSWEKSHTLTSQHLLDVGKCLWILQYPIFCILKCTLSEQIAHSTVDLHFKEISEYLHGNVMKKNKSYTRVSRSTYTHKIQPLRIRPIEPIASELECRAADRKLVKYDSVAHEVIPLTHSD